MGSQHLVHLNDANFNESISNGIVLVDFFAEWCGPCRMIAPIVDALASEMAGKVTVAKVDTDESPNAASFCEVTSIPTLVLFKEGKLINKVVGLRDIDFLRAMIKSALGS